MECDIIRIESEDITAQAPMPITQAKEERIIGYYGDSDFLKLIAEKPSEMIWGILDELMDTLALINPRLHDAVMDKLKQI